jgi:hypothetical protein
MAELEATIPENSETIEAPPAIEEPSAQEPEPPQVEPKRGRGRPAGSKDKAPRTTKPKVRVEPIPSREPPAPKRAPAPAPEPSPVPEPAQSVVSSQLPTPEQRPPSPEPPSPRTLFRQTSAHLLNLRDIMNSQKRASVAERYTSRLHAWPVV